MATDATGAPSTVFAFPKYNPDADAPSGLGLNAIVDDIDSKLNARFVFTTEAKNTNEVPVWNGTAWTWEKVKAANVNSEAATNGQVLTANGSGGAAWTSGSGAFTVISDQVLGSAVTTITFSSIPSTYKDLRLVFQGRGDTAASTVAANVRFNNDSAANYDWEQLSASGTTAVAAENLAVAQMQLCGPAAANAPANVAGHAVIDIPNYAATVFQKQCSSTTSTKSVTTSGGIFVQVFSGFWRNTAAINRIDIIAAAGNWIIGTRATLYGIG